MSKLSRNATKALMFAFLYTGAASATVNTLTNTGEYGEGSEKICIYEGSGRTETIVIESSRACPSKKTFH